MAAHLIYYLWKGTDRLRGVIASINRRDSVFCVSVIKELWWSALRAAAIKMLAEHLPSIHFLFTQV